LCLGEDREILRATGLCREKLKQNLCLFEGSYVEEDPRMEGEDAL
jgi:hypothetical protein